MKHVQKIVFLSFMIACGILLQILESFLPILIIVPGFKIGFANIASVLSLKIWSIKEMWIVSLCRIFLASLLMGTLFSVSFWLSMSGGLLSLVGMSIAKKVNVFSIYGISILGAAMHSVGQVMMITWIYQQYFMQIFLPVLLALSIVSGIIIALISNLVYIRIEKRMVLYGKV